MTKFSKKITLILLVVLCLALGVSVLVACDPNKGDNYSVTVYLDQDTPASGVSVAITKGGADLGTKTTDSNGKASFKLAEDNYEVVITPPAHYNLPDNATLTLTAEAPHYTVTLVEDFAYVITLVDLDNNPFYAEGVQVGICTVVEPPAVGNCLPLVDLASNGVAKIYVEEEEKGDYHVKITDLPEEYYYEADEEGYSRSANLTAEVTEATITIFHVKETTTTVVTVEETLTKFADQDGTLLPVAIDGTAELVYNETDKFYHLGEVDGPVVVVLLTKPNSTDRFKEEGALAYFELVDIRAASYVYNVAPEGSPYYVEDLKDYRIFLRGFKDFEWTYQGIHQIASIPETLETENYYANENYVNSDGVYPLTKELEAFLKDFAKYNSDLVSSRNLPANTAEGCGWLFPCYYYGEATADAIEGEYKLVSITEEDTTINVGEEYTINFGVLADALTNGKVTANSAKIVVRSTGFSLLRYDNFAHDFEPEDGAYDGGAWTKSGAEYTFTCDYGELTYANGTLTYVDGETVMVFQKA